MLRFYLIFLGLDLVMVVKCVPKGQYFITQPSDVTGIAGDHLTLNCVIGNMEGSCQWSKDGLGFGTDPTIPDYPRIAMDTDKQGDCQLNIFPVLPEDEGIYTCEVGSGGGVPGIVSDGVMVRVDVPPGQPVIKQAGDTHALEIVEGDEVVLDCESSGAKPAARVQWTDDDGEVITDNLIEVVQENVKTKTFKTMSTLNMKPTRSLNLTCSAFSESFPEPRISRKLGISVKHSPRLSLHIGKAEEGSTSVVKCESEANPTDVTFKWFVNDDLLDETSEILKIKNIPKNLNGAILSCEAENSIGRSKASKLLNVKFAPQILTQPQTKIARSGTTVELTCLAEGNPKPSYVWVKGTPEQIVGVSQNLVITASEETEDNYTCKVFAEGHKPVISNIAAVKVLRKPEVFTESVKQATVGEDVILQCRVNSLSSNTKVTWTKNDQPIDKQSPKHHILFSDSVFQFASDLIIYKVEQTDFANYGCFATNEVGTDYKVVSLQEEEIINFLTASLGINTVVGSILLLCVIIYKKRKSIKTRGNEEELERPKIVRHILPPPYRKEDPAVTGELLFDRRIHEDYLEINQEFFHTNNKQ